MATKTISKANKLIIYSLRTTEITFSLKQIGRTNNCNRELIRTEHPKLLIFENNNAYNNILYMNDLVNAANNIANFDLATYVNSKFVYVERHIGMQLNDLLKT